MRVHHATHYCCCAISQAYTWMHHFHWHLGSWDFNIIIPVVLLSMLTVFVFAAFVTLMTVPYGVPPLGLPFSLVSLVWLLSVSDSIRLPTTLVPEVR